ncbi:MAG TPA: hypothetical protein VE961_26010 [Pyrinomonadaceae bacterium]|nr:hypothetical protein [Pyrinomonadaceae bacterium]
MSVSLRYQSLVLLQIIAACALATSAAAQDPELPRLPAPPPMHLVSKSDRTELDSARDPKARMRAAITIAEAHLTQAEKLTDDKKFDEALAALGGYLGLIGDLRDFFAKLDATKNSTRDLYRHFEWQVRTHIPRLAIIQRSTPAAYVRNIKDAEEFIKDTRDEALDSFYGHTVLKEPPPEKALAPPSGGAKDSANTKHP